MRQFSEASASNYSSIQNIDIFRQLERNQILIIDDDEVVRTLIQDQLSAAGFENVLTLSDPKLVMPTLAKKNIGIVLLDLVFENDDEIDGYKILEKIKRDYPHLTVVVVTGQEDNESIIRCIRLGASDYLTKPLDMSRLLTSIKISTELNDLKRENLALRSRIINARLSHPEAFNRIVTRNKDMISLFAYAEGIADTEMPVLIQGATGTGKELFAQSLHNISRPDKPFIPVHLAGMDGERLNELLFGSKSSGEKGVWEKAMGGTVYFDEVGEIDKSAQVVLLKFIDRFGAKERMKAEEEVPIRITSGSSIDLRYLTRQNMYRKDLYYRLRYHIIEIPQLKDRKEDIPFLSEYFAKRAAEVYKVKPPTINQTVSEMLMVLSYPGNVRELKNIIFDAVESIEDGKVSNTRFAQILARSMESNQGSESRVTQNVLGLSEKQDPFPTFDLAEDLLIREALRRSKGRQNVAANLLGISRQALNKRLKRKTGEDTDDLPDSKKKSDKPAARA